MVEAFENTKAFIKAALADRAHLKKPGYVNEYRWVRAKNILGIYYFTPTATTGDLARMYGFANRERPSQIIENCLKHLYSNCSIETQQAYELSQLYNKKPYTLEQSLKMSRILGGATAGIVSLASQGKTAEQILQAGYTARELGRARRCAARWGNKRLPYIRPGCVENTQLFEALQKEEDPEEIKKLLARVNASFYNLHSRGEVPLLLSAKNIFLRAGIPNNYNRRGIYPPGLIKLLEETDEPIPFGSLIKTVKSGPQKGPQVYYFTLTRFQEPAIRLLKASVLKPRIE
ncbi:hypothetical protein HYU45_03170 [Candidatus Daviesbacteria bacterium]|nr:hypothetical protein [Candidatus Daviesbacteria bacterium]